VGVFVAEMNESIASGTPLRLFYRLRRRDGSYGVFESVGHAHIAAAKFAPNPHNQSPFCQAVFVMSRPYPTRNTALLDSFLEHKVENERLRRRIAELRREEEAEAEAEDAQKRWLTMQSQDGRSDIAPSESTTASTAARVAAAVHAVQGIQAAPDSAQVVNTIAAANAILQGGSAVDATSMPPPQTPGHPNAALTRHNLEDAVAGSRPDSLRDKMARYEGGAGVSAPSHADTIELLTGLRYIEGERSRGITTGNTSPALIRGDAGIPIPPDRDPRSGEKSKKKLKALEEYVCTDCGKSYIPVPDCLRCMNTC
jgi:hypothetical protein